MATGPQKEYLGRTVQSGARVAEIDVGLRAYMQKVFGLMAGGLTITGLVAFFTAQSPAMLQLLYGSPLRWVIFFAPIGIAMLFGFRIQAMRASTAQMVFWLFSALMGLSLASIFIVYTGESIARTFFIAAATFAGMALYGYTTKRDLSGFGSFLIMGVWGLLIAMVVNIFLASTALHWAISVIGVLVFTGLTAYDSQKIKAMYSASDGHEVGAKKAVMGALNLYLDFINLFVFLLQFLGDRR
ncbi:MAG: Bax inhibitor-1/YccA family protein [Dongiaceae bacterium]